MAEKARAGPRSRAGRRAPAAARRTPAPRNDSRGARRAAGLITLRPAVSSSSFSAISSSFSFSLSAGSSSTDCSSSFRMIPTCGPGRKPEAPHDVAAVDRQAGER